MYTGREPFRCELRTSPRNLSKHRLEDRADEAYSRTVAAAATRDARRLAIEQHLPLVYAIARRFADRGEPLEDLVQVGAVGLINAVDRFDPERGVTLGAYAAPTIAGEIRRHLRDRVTLIRIPRDAGDEAAAARFPLPLEAAADSRPDDDAERGLARSEDRALVANGLRALPPRERRVVQLRYYGDLSQRGIAERLGISQVHVSRILRHSLRALGRELSRTAA
jgi:RNA polymerase sigma-B factor